MVTSVPIRAPVHQRMTRSLAHTVTAETQLRETPSAFGFDWRAG